MAAGHKLREENESHRSSGEPIALSTRFDPRNAGPSVAACSQDDFAPRISKIESDLNLLKWMIGFNLALTVAILWRIRAH